MAREKNLSPGTKISGTKIMFIALLLIGVIGGALIEHYTIEPFFQQQTAKELSDLKNEKRLLQGNIADCINAKEELEAQCGA